MSLHTTTLDALRIDRTKERRRWGPVLATLLVLAVLGGGGYAAWRFWPAAPIPVRTATVPAASASGSSRTLLNASGYVTARRHATVSSKVTGKVIEVLVEEGMQVEEGQVLARIDDRNVQMALGLAEAQLESNRRSLGETQASLEQARREETRLKTAAERGAASPVELERAETQVRTLAARLERQSAEVTVAEREVMVWRQQLEDTVIRAPFSGVVTTKNAQPGEMISPMSVGGFTRTGICTIVDMDSLEIEVDVGESYINRVLPGQAVVATLDSYPEWRIPARVIAIIPTADRQKATVKVRVGFDELDQRILPDMSVKVAFQGAAEPAQVASGIELPAAAVVSAEGRDVAWVVRDGKVERRAVSVETRQGDRVVIRSGLSGGERVVVEPPPGLKEGVEVKESRR